MSLRTNDRGSTHVLEAVVVASIMVSAMAFVATYDQPVTTQASARAELAQIADDALSGLYSTPVTDSAFGTDALSAAIGECLNNICDRLTRKLGNLMPEGGAYALYVSNGYDTYPVYVTSEPTGEAVSASQAFEPAWSNTFVSTATDLVGVDDALLTYALPVFNSNVVTPGGSHLVIKVEGSRRDGSDYVMISSASTVARDAADGGVFSASLYFVDSAGNPMAVHSLPDAAQQERDVILRLEETQGGTLPAGVEVAVELPRGFIGHLEPASNPGWEILTAATDKGGAYEGSTITARLEDPLTSDHKDLVVTLEYEEDVLDYYPIHARLYRGAYAHAGLILRAETHSESPVHATPMFAASIPSPMGNGVGAGSWTTWTLSAYVPVDGSAPIDDISPVVNVHSIEIREEDGNAIFGAVQPIQSMGGSWAVGGDSIVWTGDVDLHYENLLNLSFQVKASGEGGPTDARAAFVPPVTFDDWTGKVIDRSGWGFHRSAILPASGDYGGFNTDAAGGSEAYKKQHPISANGVYRSTQLPGTTTYNTSIVGSVEEALYGSYVLAEDRTVALGGEVVINANVQSLLFALAEAGQRAGVTLRFYPPWAGDLRKDEFNVTNLDQGLLSSEVTQVAMLDINDDGFPDPIVGTTNGRVLAYHGLTGQRLQGNSFTAPVTAAAEETSTFPRITVLTTTTIANEPYIVVGTDRNSDGLFVLAKNLSVAWTAVFNAADVLAIDASKSIVGDARPEIVVARSYESGGASNALVYVFKANARPDIGQSYDLEPVPHDPPLAQDPNAFYYTLGEPTTVTSQSNPGPYGLTPGILIPVQTTADPGITLNLDSGPVPTAQRSALSTPRAGLQAVSQTGGLDSVLFGAPSSVVRDFDHDGDGIDDVVMGGTSGYVIMANGKVLTQPIYSYLPTGATNFISADSPSSTESYVLSDTGMVYVTDDAWITYWGPDTAVPGGRAISSNEFNSFWVVGADNAIWKSEVVVDPPLPQRGHMPTFKEIVPTTPVVSNDATYFLAKSYDFNDIWFRGDEGWIVGSMCAGVACPTVPGVLHTTDGGDTWTALGVADYNGAPTQDLTRVKFVSGTGWMLGEGGTIVRYTSGTGWAKLAVGAGGTSETFRDIACKPGDPDQCIVVGDAGVAFRILNATSAIPDWQRLTGEKGLPTDKTLWSVGYQDADRIYIGSQNRVFVSYHGANWSTLPMNYIENDVRVVNALGDGSGFLYGGSSANARIWLLHDYHTQSMAQTTSFAADIPDGAVVTGIELIESNVSLGGQTVLVRATANNNDWTDLGTLTVVTDDPTIDSRSAVLPNVEIPVAERGDDLRFQIRMNTTGDKTIVSPHVRLLKFRVSCTPCTPSYRDISIDFTTDTQKDPTYTTADWNPTLDVLRQRLVQEYWTRNVSGEVLDMQTGYDVIGTDGIDDIYVATGDVLSENSPDHIIYAGTNISRVINADDRVYLLDGGNGDPVHTSSALAGEVRAIRVADVNADGDPEAVYAVTWHEVSAQARLYALHPVTLDTQWSVPLTSELPSDLELGKSDATTTSIFAATERPSSQPTSAGHLWAWDSSTRQPLWTAIPDDMGKYEVRKKVDPKWFFGPHVVEVEVEWEQTYEVDGVPTEILQSARFYDHFMVTPPDSLAPPTPVYSARLLMWMRDWG